MRTSILSRSISIITGLALVAPIAHAEDDFRFNIEQSKGTEAFCKQYFTAGVQGDYTSLADYQKAAGNAQAVSGAGTVAAGEASKAGDGVMDSTAPNHSTVTAIDACLKQTDFYIKQLSKCANPKYGLSTHIQAAENYANKISEACSLRAKQFGLDAGTRQQLDAQADTLKGSGAANDAAKKPGALARTGGFLKDNLVPIGVGAAVGLGAYFLMKDKDDGKKKPASETPPPDTTPPPDVDPPIDLVIDTPTDSLTQSELLAKIPTEQTSPVTASANATEFDPAYTGVGSDHGDTSGLRDESAGDTVTGFKCMVGESDAACRERYACTKDEALSTCQARWDSGQVAIK